MKKKIIIIFLVLIFLVIVFIIWVNFYVLNFSKTNYYNNVDDLENTYVWLVLWAAVMWNYKPSNILEDRLKVAYEAYEKWKIEKIIVSWDNSISTYNEPLVMQKYLLELWVEIDDIYLDYAWFDTYDSIYRAKEIFWVKSLLIFTQNFHLKRSMYISKRLWIQTYWIETNLNNYINTNYNNFREIFARIKAFLDVEILSSKPKYLWDKIKIVSDEEIMEAKEEIFR